jgi:lysophospholipase L1-like esterase
MRLALPLLLLIGGTAHAQTGFALRDGDRVAFYGDSITESQQYPNMIETFVRTRMPRLNVRFVNAGVGGDRTTGSWMGTTDQRLSRDLFSRRPTVVTVMLGMNDASYRPFDQGIFDTYAKGYEHIVGRFKREIPNARVWLIRPSPFDDVTQNPGWDPGYNSVLGRYGDFGAELARRNGYGVIDLNAPVVTALQQAKAANPELAKRIIPDRVHPGAAGHLVMAWGVVRAWGMPATVSQVEIDATSGQAKTDNASVRDVSTRDGLAWTATEGSLPFPLDRKDPVTGLVLSATDFDSHANQEILNVRSLVPGQYRLSIDGQIVGTFSDRELDQGVNLAKLDTPMTQQAAKVRDLVWKRAGVRQALWRNVEFALQDVDARSKRQAIRGMESLEEDLVRRSMEAAKPVPHRFSLTKVAG